MLGNIGGVSRMYVASEFARASRFYRIHSCNVIFGRQDKRSVLYTRARLYGGRNGAALVHPSLVPYVRTK